MTDNKHLQQVQEASWNVVDAVRGTNQAVLESLVALQDHNLRFAHNVFLNWAELLTLQTESVQRLQQQWGQQNHELQDAFPKLVSTSMQIYRDFLLTPFSFTRQLGKVTKDIMPHERESTPSYGGH